MSKYKKHIVVLLLIQVILVAAYLALRKTVVLGDDVLGSP